MITKYRNDSSDSMFSTGYKFNKRLKSEYKATKTVNPYLTPKQVEFYNKINENK